MYLIDGKDGSGRRFVSSVVFVIGGCPYVFLVGFSMVLDLLLLNQCMCRGPEQFCISLMEGGYLWPHLFGQKYPEFWVNAVVLDHI